MEITELELLKKIKECNEDHGVAYTEVFRFLNTAFPDTEDKDLISILMYLQDQGKVEIISSKISEKSLPHVLQWGFATVRITHAGKQSLEHHNPIHTLQRYKTLCEWYDREELYGAGEIEMTRRHLARYLFQEGFTYSLFETVVPSGEIDNFTFGLGRKFASLPEALVVECKIYTDNTSVFQEVKNQLSKRINELGFEEGYCVIFNKSGKNPVLPGERKGELFLYRTGNQKKIYFLIVNLYDKNTKPKSTDTVSEVKIPIE